MWIFSISAIIITPILVFIILFVINVGALPYLPTVMNVTDLASWDRRWCLLPWHVVLAPVIIIFIPLFFLTGYAGLSDLRSAIAYPYAYRIIQGFLWLLGSLAAFCFVLMFTLLGFHLEFPRVIHIAYVFIPMYIVEFCAVIVFGVHCSTLFKKNDLYIYILWFWFSSY